MAADTRNRQMLVLGMALLVGGPLAVAQSMSQQNTSPSAASSPSQQQAVGSHQQSAPATDNSSPSSSSSPHQQAVTGGDASSKQAMKDCMSKEKAKNSGASKADMRKTCQTQMSASPQ